MTASAQRPRCQAHAALTVLILTQSCLGFSPSLVSKTSLKHTTSRWRSTTTCPLLLKATSADEDDGEELVGMAEFLARKAERGRQSGGGMANGAAASSVRRAGDEDDGEELVGMAEFLARKAERDRQQLGGGMATSAMSSSQPAAGEEDGEELVGMAEFLARKAGRDRHSAGGMTTPAASSPPGGGVDFNGGIFPSDVFPAAANDDITLREERFEPGQPEALVGFWKLYGGTGNREDLSGRVILRADGQVIGGPTVRKTPGVTWSDPEGLQPVGGRWSVYVNEDTRRTRFEFTIVLSFKKKQQLEMDGVVMRVDSWNEQKGEVEPQLQIFGSVSKRNGDTEMEAGEGDFSMVKVSTGEDKLVATVGTQQKRIW